jgi:hypothetical protein
MLVLEWNNPKITIGDIETYLRSYLGDTYDGITIDESKMSVLTHGVLTTEQEDVIRSWFYSVNDTPTMVQLHSPMDSQGKPYFTQSMTNTDWYYSPHALDFYTAKYKSLYNRTHLGAGIDDGTDAGDAWLTFYDASGSELVHGGYEETDEEFQARLSAQCIKTIMHWEKKESFDVVGAQLYIANQPVERAYLWVVAAPDIPYEYGGSKPFMGRGMNLQMMRDKSMHQFDAKTSKTVQYDPVYHSGKVDCVIKHAVGEQIGIQLVYVLYEE